MGEGRGRGEKRAWPTEDRMREVETGERLRVGGAP